jgi:hypothetical protein
MIMAGGNRGAWRETLSSATLCIISLTSKGHRSNPGIRGERPATSRRSHGKATEEY